MIPATVPFSWLLGPALVLLAGGAGYLAGDHDRNNAWLAKQALVERQAREDFDKEVRRSQAAATSFVQAHQAMQTQFETLEGKFHELRTRGPLVVYRVGNARGAAVSGAGTPTAAAVYRAGVDAPAPAELDAGAGAPLGAGGPAVGLSLGAVWMWNSALAATDVPAGACGAADTANPACAADAGIDLAAAWANQAVNAKTCALDRLRYQRLIDFLTATAEPHP
nr:hypothetical protein [uncultured Albidiferax sp.]